MIRGIFLLKNGLRWRDASAVFGPHKTIYNRSVRWSRLGVFNRIFNELARKAGKSSRLMIDATHLKAHRTAASLLKKDLFPDTLGARKGGLNSKLHAVCEGQGRPVVLMLSKGQMSNYKGAALMLNVLPPAKELFGDRGFDADWFTKLSMSAASPRASQDGLMARRRSATIGILYRQRHKIENMCGRLKNLPSRRRRTGGAFTPAMTVAPTPSYPQSASPQPSSSGSDQ